MIDLQKDGYFINLDKKIGISSARAVAIVKRNIGAKKVGHCGTLDPFASGVLMLAINAATKQAQAMMGLRKQYRFTIQFGENRDSEDVEGKITATSTRVPKISEIISKMIYFLGEIDQVPPNFSAISIDGKRSYERARAGENFLIPSRKTSVYRFVLIDFWQKTMISSAHRDKQESIFFAEFLIECSKGTYIRSISRDICQKLGLCGFVCNLRRIAIGENYEKNSIMVNNFILTTRYFPSLLNKALIVI